MPLPEQKVARQTLHHRDIVVRGYRRAEGLFDVEGHLQGTKENTADSTGSENH